ncbi:hypothetical protein TcCL_ESM00424 [Trypanosoma cruzi]|nr:hypothetical protein TcCL_ESM00424 [Trypanosoma cruzi]
MTSIQHLQTNSLVAQPATIGLVGNSQCECLFKGVSKLLKFPRRKEQSQQRGGWDDKIKKGKKRRPLTSNALSPENKSGYMQGNRVVKQDALSPTESHPGAHSLQKFLKKLKQRSHE